MAVFGGSPASELCEALKRRDRYVELSAVRSFDSLLDEAYKLEPRLTSCVKEYSGKKSANGKLGISKTYRIELVYEDGIQQDISKIVMDDGTWKPSDAIGAGRDVPESIQVISQNVNDLARRIDEDAERLRELYPGMGGVSYAWSSCKANGYSSVLISLAFPVDMNRYKQFDIIGRRDMERADHSFLGHNDKSIPKLIKAFLAFSYLQQTVSYDQDSADLCEAGQRDSLERPYALMPYGPLHMKQGTCHGIAAAYKLFMERYGIACKTVIGQLDGGEHVWNIICLNEKYYHVDCACGIAGDGIYIGAFLKSDSDMSETHFWDMAKYPSCNAYTPDYDAVEQYIVDHHDALLRCGVDDLYMCPETVRE